MLWGPTSFHTLCSVRVLQGGCDRLAGISLGTVPALSPVMIRGPLRPEGPEASEGDPDGTVQDARHERPQGRIGVLEKRQQHSGRHQGCDRHVKPSEHPEEIGRAHV